MSRHGRALVLGEDTRAFLATIRSLGRYGVEVHVAWCPLDAPALQSRYVKEIHRIPANIKETDDWIPAFQCLLRHKEFDLVLPLTDSAILPLQLHRSEFESLARICLLPDDTYRICSDKNETYKLAEEQNVPLPRQRIVRNGDEAMKCAEAFGYPVVLKPKKSVLAQNPSLRQVVRKAYDERELLELTKQLTVNQEVLVQENFIGNGVGVEVLCKDGQILTAFQHERVHEPLLGGGSSYRKSLALHEGMYSATSRLMKALRYTGVVMTEYKRNSRTGDWVLIEINPRFWGSLPLSVAAGLDFPRYLYEMLVEGGTEFKRTYRTGMFSRNWSLDIQWFLENMRADRSDPSLLSRPIRSVIREVGNIVQMRERSDTLTLDDPRPAWADLRTYLGEKAFRVLKLLKSFRRHEQKRLLRTYRSAKNVVFVCCGNICRSPFAKSLLDRAGAGKVVTSAGTLRESGRKSPGEAVEAANIFGIDLAGHCSRVAAAKDILLADLIIVFDRSNWLAVRSICPEVMPRVAYLGAADPDQPLEVTDPAGHAVEEFLRCYRRVQHLVERLAKSPQSSNRFWKKC